MAVAEKTPEVAAPPAATRRKRSFSPRYPAWLTVPSLLYYTVFFLGPMAILVAFSLATQQGFGSLRYGFDTSQYRQVGTSLYLTIFARTLVMASVGTLLTIAVGYPVAAHAWINWLLTPSTAVTEMNYHTYKIPMPTALDQLSSGLRDDPMFNVPKTYTDNYHYILNVSPQVVEARTQIYTEFKAA